MTTYLDMLPDELYQMIYNQIKQICVQQAAAIGARRNRFTHIPNRRTNDSVIYHWLSAGEVAQSVTYQTFTGI